MKSLDDLNRQFEHQQAARTYLQWSLARAAVAKGIPGSTTPIDMYRRMAGSRSPHLDLISKAAVGALGTDDINTMARLKDQFFELPRRQALAGKMTGLRRIPPLTRVWPISGGSSAAFVPEGRPIPVSRLTIGEFVFLRPAKIATIIPVTEDLIQSADPAAMPAIMRDIVRALATSEDEVLLDGEAGVPDGRPASILYNVSSSGSGSDLEAEITTLVGAVRNGQAEAPYFITSMIGAMHLATARNSDGERLFPDVSIVSGGGLYGVPVLISPGATNKLILLDAAGLFYADQGAELEPSRHSALQLSDAPSDGAASVVSMFQANSVALRGLRYVSWLAAENSVAYITLPVGSPVF